MKIVKGNDFTMRIPVRKIVSGEQVKFPLPACTDIAVNLVSAYRRTALVYNVAVADDSVIEARVEGDSISVGTYALEVKGKIFGNDWRSNEYEQVQIVDNNASGDTAFEPQEGEDSVDMDTAVVILPPSVELSGLIDDVENTLGKAEEKMEDIQQRADKAVADCADASSSALTAADRASEQADRAKGYADHPNKISDDGYWMAWDETAGDYVKTEYYARGGLDFPTFNVNDEDMSLEVLVGRDTDAGRYFIDDDVCAITFDFFIIFDEYAKPGRKNRLCRLQVPQGAMGCRGDLHAPFPRQPKPDDVLCQKAVGGG